jgi:bifunctional enzyme CysN/CysC
MDIVNYLKQDEHKDLLRLVTAGSVDDGKSTLIGRLLFESKGIYEDQLAAVRSASGKMGSSVQDMDLALVTDGLKAEREQGITIDVAYRYFSTPKRKFIIADTPGHEQYTRNMATGASTAQLAIVLVDARLGVLTQSKRHAFIASLLGIPHVVVAVNKMDLVDYSQEIFENIRHDFTEFAARLNLNDLTFIPVSALVGDNVVERSDAMSWYDGLPLLRFLEEIHIASDRNLVDLRFPVQVVSRPDLNFRGYMGTVASGVVRPGDDIMVLPAGNKSKVKDVLSVDGPCEKAFPPLATTIVLEDEIDISKGDMLVHPNNLPHVDNLFEAMLVWMDDEPMKVGKPYLIKHCTRQIGGSVSELRYRVDVNTLRQDETTQLQLNEIGRIVMSVNQPIAFDAYTKNRETGAFIVIDRMSNNTVGAGMILDHAIGQVAHTEAGWQAAPVSGNITSHQSQITPDQRNTRMGHKAGTVWLTGLTGAGKTTIAYALEKKLFEQGVNGFVLDGGNARSGVGKDLSFSARDRSENIRRTSEVATMFNQAGLVTICSLLSPYADDRDHAARAIGRDNFMEVHLSTSLDVCRERRPELYAKADAGEIPHFSGISAPYEAPEKPDLHLDTAELSVDQCVDRICALLTARGMIG